MNAEHRERWEREIRNAKGRLRKPADLLRRAASSEDFIDSAVIGGVGIADIVAGKIAESQIPSNVIEAFHAEYPQYGTSFVQAVHRFAGDPDRLMGLVNGVKGKLFEVDYADWLTHGHLPQGLTAELAHHANNPGWDIVIHDAQGHIHNLLQLKATESLDYVRQALEAHPGIDVVVPHELYEKITDHPDLFGHVFAAHETLHQVNGEVANAVGHAEAAGATHFPIVGPVLVITFAAALNYQSYRQGRITLTPSQRFGGSHSEEKFTFEQTNPRAGEFSHT